MILADEIILYQGKWIELRQRTYHNPRGGTSEWEVLDRTKHPHAVVMLATLVPSNQIVIIKQFRPGINSYVYGLPAGLCESDDIAENALRELLEETGYVGTITEISPVLASFPALSSSTMQLVHITIDETNPTNINPMQALEDNEEIEVITMAKDKLKPFLIEEQQKGTAIASGLWYLLCGIY
jgi:ADP-ribose pyrophosphatase